jgi:hypothetical protein
MDRLLPIIGAALACVSRQVGNREDVSLSAVLREAVVIDELAELLEVKAWVLATFDLATSQQPSGVREPPPPRFAERCGRAWLQLFAEHKGRKWLQHARPSVHAANPRRKRQLQRLVALAPAAVAWVERHAGMADCPPWEMFRHHLARRCDAIIERDEVGLDDE